MIQYQDAPEGPWKTSRFPWLPEDIPWLNTVVQWPKYRETEEAA